MSRVRTSHFLAVLGIDRTPLTRRGLDPAFPLLFYDNPASRAQFWLIPRPGSGQIPNAAPFLSEIPDPLRPCYMDVCRRNKIFRSASLDLKSICLIDWRSSAV